MPKNSSIFDLLADYKSPFGDWRDQVSGNDDRATSIMVKNLHLKSPEKRLVAVIFFETREPENPPLTTVLNTDDRIILNRIINTNLLFQFYFEIVGYADSRDDRFGKPNYNKELSERRALAVSEILFPKIGIYGKLMASIYTIIANGVDVEAVPGDNMKARRAEIWAQPFSIPPEEDEKTHIDNCYDILASQLKALKSVLKNKKRTKEDVITKVNTLLYLYVISIKFHKLYHNGVPITNALGNRFGQLPHNLRKRWGKSECAIVKHILNMGRRGLMQLLGGRPNYNAPVELYPDAERLNYLINLIPDKPILIFEITVRRQIFLRTSNDPWLQWVELMTGRYNPTSGTLNPFRKFKGLPEWNNLPLFYEGNWKKKENQFTGKTIYNELRPSRLTDGSPSPSRYMSNEQHNNYMRSEFQELDLIIANANSKILNEEFSTLIDGAIK